MNTTHTDIIIIGAGLSGIGAACHLSRKTPIYVILEARTELGGTWSLFKYPGIRSDSDMYTFGYSFKHGKTKSLCRRTFYLEIYNEAADEYKVRDHIIYQRSFL
jgi:cation diffusion facilitator CzcD-associated flavoprotein CzcO